jgi:stearoyl-CoA desaturase (delta-9 desaturase)
MLMLDYRNFIFVVAVHVLAVVALFYLVLGPVRWQTCLLASSLYFCCAISITGGYHRLFAHRTYQAARPIRLFYLLFAAASLQNSALRWCVDHRAHHANTDSCKDPYSIGRGFLWAHIGWVICRGNVTHELGRVRDLAADPLISFQHRYYPLLAFVMGVVLPGTLGSLWGDTIGVLLVGCCLRVVLQWHATFAVNSIAHTIGRQPYTTTVSARDSWFTALVTLGEGYHNYHHRFPSDYRNGVRWYQFDPTKWFIWMLAKLRLAAGLRRVPPEVIESARSSVLACGHTSASPQSQRMPRLRLPVVRVSRKLATRGTL